MPILLKPTINPLRAITKKGTYLVQYIKTNSISTYTSSSLELKAISGVDGLGKVGVLLWSLCATSAVPQQLVFTHKNIRYISHTHPPPRKKKKKKKKKNIRHIIHTPPSPQKKYLQMLAYPPTPHPTKKKKKYSSCFPFIKVWFSFIFFPV